jgi:putative transposase
MRKTTFENNGIYHIYNRGVEKRQIFLDNEDRFRFLHDLYEFNDKETAENIYYRKIYEIVSRRKVDKKPLVGIHAFCLMPNHFHLIVNQKDNNGISNFMRKLGIGYSMYFNKKYERVGTLFQGRFKAILVNKNEYISYLHYYIHLNPLELIEPDWKEGKIKDLNKAIEFLESYRWSSYMDYIGKKNFPSLINKEFLSGFAGEPENYRKDMIEWLKSGNLTSLRVPIS